METKWLRRSFVLLLCMVLMLGSSTSAFAYYNDEEGNDGVTVEEVTPTPEPSPVVQDPEPVQEPQGQITPDGNLSLLDDLDYSARGGLQFMTVTTRSGHVYYIVIDRTTNSQNVYFLNQVDEYDLMSIMSDAEKAQYEQDQKTQEQTRPQNVVPVQPVDDQQQSQETSQKPSQQFSIGKNLTMLAFFGGIGLLVVLGFYFLKIKPKKNGGDFDEDRDFEDDEGYENEDEPPFEDPNDLSANGQQ